MQGNTAVFWDIENMTQGYNNTTIPKNYIDQLKQAFNIERIIFQKAYANWSDYKISKIKQYMVNDGIEIVQVTNPTSKSIKNIADMHLVSDFMESVFMSCNDPSIKVDNYIIVSGDGGYIPAIRKAMERGKGIGIWAVKGSENAILCKVVDKYEYINFDGNEPKDLNDEKIVAHFGRIPQQNLSKEDTETRVRSLFNWLKANYTGFTGKKGIYFPTIKSYLNNIIPGFNHEIMGFARFIDAIEHIIQGTGLSVFKSLENPNTIMIALSGEKIQGYSVFDSVKEAEVNADVKEAYIEIIGTGNPCINIYTLPIMKAIIMYILSISKATKLEDLYDLLEKKMTDYDFGDVMDCLDTLVNLGCLNTFQRGETLMIDSYVGRSSFNAILDRVKDEARNRVISKNGGIDIKVFDSLWN